MVTRQKTIEDVMAFILANAPSEGEAVKRNPFAGRRFGYELVDGAINELHSQGKFPDLEAYDLRKTLNVWDSEYGINHKLARTATKNLLKKLQQEKPEKPLAEILTEITWETFYKHPINRYKTTLGGMLDIVYADSPYKALKDLIDNDGEFAKFSDFQPYDMHHSPRRTWINDDESKNFALAREATKVLIKKLQQERPGKPLAEILTEISPETFYRQPINNYNTTVRGMLTYVYDGKAFKALKDLIDNDDEFAKFSDFKPYDMKRANWRNPNGTKNFALAREATKMLIKKLQQEQPGKPLEQVLSEIKRRTFCKHPINRYNTTLGGMLAVVYCSITRKALMDLTKNDDEYRRYLKALS